jgi:multidrug efflux system membrane fusion protein
MPDLHCQEGENHRLLIKPRGKRLVLEIAVLIFLLGGCGPGPSETIHEKGEVIKVRIEAVEPSPLTECAVLPGTVVSAERIEVSSRLTGYVYDLNVHEGQSVKKGQLLFTVDPTDIKAEIRQAKAGLAKAKAALADARDNYERYKNLYRQQAATKQQYEEYEKGYNVALGNYQSAEAALTIARSQLKYAEVRAPFDGLMVSKQVDNGQLTAPGNPLLVLENQHHLQVQVEVDAQAFAHLRLGQELSVRFEGPNFKMHSLTGSVERLVAAANPVTHTHLVKVGLPAHSTAWSGAYALVSIPIGEQKAIIVPPAAIHTRAGLTGIFVVTEAGLAQFRMVTPGELVARGRVVLSGLFSGDRVIVSAEGPLANGVKIQVEPESGHE